MLLENQGKLFTADENSLVLIWQFRSHEEHFIWKKKKEPNSSSEWSQQENKRIKGRGKCDNNCVSWESGRKLNMKRWQICQAKNRFSLLFFRQTSSFHCLYMAIYLSVPHNYLSVLLLWKSCIYGRCLSVPDPRCIHVLRPTKCHWERHVISDSSCQQCFPIVVTYIWLL